MTSSVGTVFVVDDDESVRTALKRLLTSTGHKVFTFSSAEEFFKHDHCFDVCGCLVLDIRMPGLSGLELQDQMAIAGISIPIIFITGHGNIPTSVRAIKAGAMEFLEKPFDDRVLLDVIHRAIEKDTRAKQAQAKIRVINQRVASLTPREKEVFTLVVTGMLNKQVAFELGTSEKTIKVHRARVMQKMSAESFADLVRLAEKAGVHSPEA